MILGKIAKWLCDTPPPIYLPSSDKDTHDDRARGIMNKSEKLRAASALHQMVGTEPQPQAAIPYATPPAYHQLAPQPQIIYQQIVTVQQTSKAWKAAIAIGVLILIAGIVLVFMALRSKDAEMFAYGFAGGAAVLVGLVVTIAAKIGAWWDHG